MRAAPLRSLRFAELVAAASVTPTVWAAYRRATLTCGRVNIDVEGLLASTDFLAAGRMIGVVTGIGSCRDERSYIPRCSS